MSKESKAKEYAQNVAGSLLEKALEAAYLEGFNAGVESVEHPVTQIVENGVTYLDLGLPSGTMWSHELYMQDINTKGTSFDNFKLCFNEAQKYNLPTKEQIEELLENTKISARHGIYTQIFGPNGKYLFWRAKGIFKGFREDEEDVVAIWINDNKSNHDKNTANCLIIYSDGSTSITSEFTGYRMHFALVKTKE